MYKKRKTPNDVFTPRKPEVNDSMYVHRPDLEERLINAFNGTRHIIICGESGTGKSWLYKKVLKNQNIRFMAANLANASRLKSINAEFKNLVDREQKAVKTEYKEKKKFSASGLLGFFGFGLSHEGLFKISSKEPFEACLEFLSKKAKMQKSCLVLDNLEAIFNSNELMKELADIILLLDDERYGKYNVKILIVGIPQNLKEYFLKIHNLSPVVNRLQEIPEVSRLELPQAKELIRKGFCDELGYCVDSFEEVSRYICWVTDRIPEKIQDYCLELGLIAEKYSCIVDISLLEMADKNWLIKSLSSNYSVIENLMNSRETSVGRRNQTLYALGKFENNEFKYSDIETIIKAEFPTSTKSATINVSGVLSDLERKDNPIIKRTPKGDSFVFIDPKYRMCLRAMLVKNEKEIVEKLDISTFQK